MSKDFYKGKLGIWRTVGGRKIFIEEGDDLETAMFKSGKFNKERYNNHLKKHGQVRKLKLTKDEYANVIHEINTNFKPSKKQFTYAKAIGNYVYFFEFIEYNSYIIYKKVKID